MFQWLPKKTARELSNEVAEVRDTGKISYFVVKIAAELQRIGSDRIEWLVCCRLAKKNRNYNKCLWWF